MAVLVITGMDNRVIGVDYNGNLFEGDPEKTLHDMGLDDGDAVIKKMGTLNGSPLVLIRHPRMANAVAGRGGHTIMVRELGVSGNAISTLVLNTVSELVLAVKPEPEIDTIPDPEEESDPEPGADIDTGRGGKKKRRGK